MGDYKQHIGFAGVLAVLYAAAASFWAGIHWLYGSIAALLATLSGLLPDLDHPIGVELKGFTGILGVLAALATWEHVGGRDPNFPFELHLWSVFIAYVAVRHGLRRVLAKLMVHRGISHSVPTGAVWGCLTYLYYPSQFHMIRVLMAAAVMLGFASHLVLDEICSVDLKGERLKNSFGTAIKFWAPSPWATLAMYSLLGFLVYRVLEIWPDDPFNLGTVTPLHLPIPRSWLDHLPFQISGLAPRSGK
jgi:membrane-bound metal-dependent hydrolase YbcI (DUF457 family)